ncbi:MAG: hypothetical protein SGJ19_03830 [Planctomycetia bacterium]|nr:hypothetical protein [Planctomycetia bacterium]
MGTKPSSNLFVPMGWTTYVSHGFGSVGMAMPTEPRSIIADRENKHTVSGLIRREAIATC